MSDLTLVAGDDAPALVGALTNTDGTPFDLTDTTVRFQMRLTTDRRWAVDASASVTGTPTAGTVEYVWATGDLDVPGEYESRWQVTYDSGGEVTHTVPANTITVEAP
jgi:hypothetical protein